MMVSMYLTPNGLRGVCCLKSQGFFKVRLDGGKGYFIIKHTAWLMSDGMGGMSWMCSILFQVIGRVVEDVTGRGF